MTEAAMEPRRRRALCPAVDVAAFTDQVEAALAAFSQDVSYACAMARQAVIIGRKRQVWAARKELREAEERARTECANHTFDCHAVAACGTGDCKFAIGEHSQITVAAGEGTARRPQYPHQTYGMDEAVTALVDRRTGSL